MDKLKALFRETSRRTFMQRGLLGVTGSAFALGRSSRVFAQDVIEITSWCVSGPRFEIPQKALIPLFRKKFPNIAVKIVDSPWGQFYQNVAVALAGGATRYDTIFHDYLVIPAQAEAGWLTPLDEYLDADPAFKKSVLDDIPPNVIDLYTYKGALYALPPDANLQLMFWRKDVLEKAGIAPPDTWEEVREAAKELTGGDQYGFVAGLQRGMFAYSVFASMLYSYGGAIYDDDTFEVKVESDAGLTALSLLQELMKYGDPVSLNATNDQVIRAFSSGRSVLAPCEWGGAGFTNKEFNEYADVTGTKIVPAGKGPGSGNFPLMGGLGFTIPAKSTKKNAVWKWIRFVLSDDAEIQETWVKTSGQPTRLSVLKKFAPTFPLFGALAESLPVALPHPRLPEAGELFDKIGTEVSFVLTGEKAPEVALKDMKDQVTKVFQTAGYL
jgi:ABC-type glycerol-3-phosphate transport system substrate-binding protein